MGRPSAAAIGGAARPARGHPTTRYPAAGATAAPVIVRSQEPTLIGEVTLKTRSMLMNRIGLPRSEVSNTGETEIPASAAIQALRASRRFPARPAAEAGLGEAPPGP